LENDDRAPCSVVEATVITLLQLAGAKVDALALEFPAATTIKTPVAAISLITDCIHDGHAWLELRLMLIIFAGYGLFGIPETLNPAAHLAPAKTSDVLPPQRPRARIGMIVAFGATPLTPIPLLPTAAMIPATCVPCHEDGLV
jgi:hypothetical protein